MKLFIQCFTLLVSFIVIFVWQNSPLKDYTVEILGLLIVLYFIVSARKKGKGFLTMGGGPLGIFLLNTLVFLLIFSTGGLNSGLLFILYFLAFGIAFVFDPLTVFVFVVGAILVFFPQASGPELTANLLKLGSFVLISPLAFFFGAQYKKGDLDDEKVNAIKERAEEAADTISEDIEEIISDEKENIPPKDLEKLNEVLEESEDLRAESSNDK